jgi:hypothetical protein
VVDAIPRFRHIDIDERSTPAQMQRNIHRVSGGVADRSRCRGRRFHMSSRRQSFVNKGSGKSFSARNRRAASPKQLERTVSEIRTASPQNTIEIEMVEAKERWSEYQLADGTTLRIKPVMIAVFREDGQLTADGEPVYSMKSTLITDVRAPARI